MENKLELEYKIFACMILKNKILDEMNFNEKCFSNHQILLNLKKIYKQYKAVTIDLISKHSKDKDTAISFIKKCLELEINYSHVYSYYQELKELYQQDQVEYYFSKLKSNEIDIEEFSEAISTLKEELNERKDLFNLNDIAINKQIEREYTNIPELDYLLKGIEYSRLNLWTGVTNHGKSTFLLQFARQCLRKKQKIFYFSGEQSKSEFKNYLYVGYCSKEQLDFITDKVNSKIYDTFPKNEIIEYFDNIYGNLLSLYNNDIPNNNVYVMISIMERAFKKGIRIFFIDNFMQLDNSERIEDQTKIVEVFKRFARDKNVIVNLVAHPRKMQFHKNRLSIFDIAGTQNIANKSENICSIIRTDLLMDAEKAELKDQLLKNNYDIEQCDGIVEVLKTKGNFCKLVGLIYDTETKTYKEAKKINPKIFTNSKKIKWEETIDE